MSGKLKHKSRSRVTYKHRMAAAQHVLNHYSVGRAHARHGSVSSVKKFLNLMKRRRSKPSRDQKRSTTES